MMAMKSGAPNKSRRRFILILRQLPVDSAYARRDSSDTSCARELPGV
jgi:hypothetical protein